MIKTSPRQFKYFACLAMLAATAGITSADVIHKLVTFGPFLFTGGSFILPLFFFFIDIIAEVYGYQASRQVIWAYFLCALLHAASIAVVLQMPSPLSQNHPDYFNWVFGQTLIAAMFGTLGILVGLFLNALFLTKWKIMTRGKYFWLRSIGSTAIGEIVQLAVFCIGGFLIYPSLIQLIEMSLSIYVLRICFAVVLSFPGTLVVNIIKRAEGVDIYDYGTNFNPFKWSLASGRVEVVDKFSSIN